MTLAFTKMHGLGNDFVVVDDRAGLIGVTPDAAKHLADRRRGVGCDQVLVLEASARADVRMRAFNPDGSEAGACGNGARCVAFLVGAERGFAPLIIETAAGLLPAEADASGMARVVMTPPRLGWRDIPLAEERDTLHLGISLGPLADPVGVDMGNPHAVFFVDDAERVDLEALGPKLERHPLFPERANIGVAHVAGPGVIRLRVWERGAGLTPACGSGACAALVAAVRRGLAAGAADLHLDGGALRVEWPGEGAPVVMTGPAALSFEGTIALPAPDLPFA